jgi:hypothetical protein
MCVKCDEIHLIKNILPQIGSSNTVTEIDQLKRQSKRKNALHM